MKASINLGAYGWRHRHWLKSFYPEDLPLDDGDDWRLSYYSNAFNTVLVPAEYWQEMPLDDCENWLDSVHSDFQFYVECRGVMFDYISLEELARSLNKLKPQLSALVISEVPQLNADVLSERTIKQFTELAESLAVEVIGSEQKIWRPGEDPEEKQFSRFAFIEDELLDLRVSRATLEKFMAQINAHEKDPGRVTVIVDHPQLQAENLSKLQAVLDIMGY